MWIGIISAVIGAAAALGGTFVTQRFTARLQEASRIEQRRLETRQLLVEVLATGREWSVALGQVLWRAAMQPMAALYGTKEFHDYESTEHAFRRALIAARLAVGDKEVAGHLQAVSGLSQALPSLVSTVSQSREDDGRLAKEGVVKDAHDQIRNFSTELDRLEDSARRVLVGGSSILPSLTSSRD